MAKFWRLSIVLALVAVGCRAEANVVLDIAEDGSGTYTVELTASGPGGKENR